MNEPIKTHPREPRRGEPSTQREKTICGLIADRTRELGARLDAMKRAAWQDNGGALPHTELAALADEMRFLAALTLAQLQREERT